MSEHLVCLSFDFDAMSGYVSRGMVTPTPISRGEFGAVGVERLLALLDDRNIQASWFIPGVVIGTYPSLCRQIAEAGHEIGHHGWTHDTPASMSREHEADALAREATRRLAKADPESSDAWSIAARDVLRAKRETESETEEQDQRVPRRPQEAPRDHERSQKVSNTKERDPRPQEEPRATQENESETKERE